MGKVKAAVFSLAVPNFLQPTGAQPSVKQLIQVGMHIANTPK